MWSTVLVALAMALLKWWWGRKDIRDDERRKIALEMATLTQTAMAWLIAAQRDPDAVSLRVESDADTISLAVCPYPSGGCIKDALQEGEQNRAK